jgi:hypothetical protein
MDKTQMEITKNGKFPLKPLFEKLTIVGLDRQLWKYKLPIKIEIWLWLIWHNAIATILFFFETEAKALPQFIN